MRICSLRGHRLKQEWNQMVWSVNNLRCCSRRRKIQMNGIFHALFIYFLSGEALRKKFQLTTIESSRSLRSLIGLIWDYSRSDLRSQCKLPKLTKTFSHIGSTPQPGAGFSLFRSLAQKNR